MVDGRTCGIIMPIGGNAEYSSSHWSQVLSIVSEAASRAGFRPRLVSDAEESAVIQKTIVTNIYEDDVIICDVSSKNPNVMLELGMRLAFDKPCVVIKDENTEYSFDTSPLKHLGYPRNLSYYEILAFQEKLKLALEAASDGPQNATFLKAFGTFKVASIETKEVPQIEILLDELRSLKELIARRNETLPLPATFGNSTFDFDIGRSIDDRELSEFLNEHNLDLKNSRVNIIGFKAGTKKSVLVFSLESLAGARIATRLLRQYFGTPFLEPSPA